MYYVWISYRADLIHCNMIYLSLSCTFARDIAETSSDFSSHIFFPSNDLHNM